MESEISIFSEIVVHQIEGVMIHDDIANIMDFMGLRGFKREHEYHALKEFCEMRSVNRYAINHVNYIPNGKGANRPVTIIPESWYNASRFKVSESERKNKIKEVYDKWREYETQTKVFYQSKFEELCELGAIASANKINCLIKDVDKELKRVERKMLEYDAVGWDMLYIVEQQECIHDEYEQKTKDTIKIEMC